MIELIEFRKAYESTMAVAGLSFRVEAGQILGLVGPNGAGKTTTLRALTGIIPSSGGQLKVADFDLDHHPLEVKQRAAYVADDPQLFHDLTVEQHLTFTASLYRVSKPTEKITALLQQFDLEAKRHTQTANLSRGMRQKLAICCAYLHDPPALLLDEPMTGLDPQSIRVLKQTIRDRAEQGAAIIISSHLLAMVEDICTHVLVMDHGRQRFFGTFDALKATFSDQDHMSLEEIFFRAVEARPVASSDTVADGPVAVDGPFATEALQTQQCR